MKKTIAQHIADFLVKKGINSVFTVVGGGAMHLNDAFYHHSGLNNYFFLHEQGACIAAEGYARVNNNLPIVSVTTGPGGINALNGVLCAWQDNIPMLVISGQVKREVMVKNSGLKLRQLGDQEHQIIETVANMTKYCTTIDKPEDVKRILSNAINTATTGRRGPCWVDIPLDIQGMVFDENDFLDEDLYYFESGTIKEEMKDLILKKIDNSSRPVIVAGSGVRTSGAHRLFVDFVSKARIPVIVAKSNADILPLDNEHYYGNFGINGGRAGNYIVQNADLLIVLGCRLSLSQIGFNYKEFAPGASIVMVDIDSEELKKDTISIDYPINCDVSVFLQWFIENNCCFNSIDKRWIQYCNDLRNQFNIYNNEYERRTRVNPYYFAKVLQDHLGDDAIVVVGNSCASVSVKQMGVKKASQRMWGNINCGTMGYDLPASIGASIAGNRTVVCIAGDGSLQMNIQELQTMINYNIPIKLFVFNNNGYKSIVISQKKNFGRLSGCTSDSGLTLPSIKKIAEAYGIPYFYCDRNCDVESVISDCNKQTGYVICEIIEDEEHTIVPKLGNHILPDGRIESPSLCDLDPTISESLNKKYNNYAEYCRLDK